MAFPIFVRDLAGRTALWERDPDVRRGWRLTAGGVPAARLRWPRLFSTMAEGTTAEGAWTFRRQGLLGRQLSVLENGSGRELGTFQRRWNGQGTLDLGGRRVAWAREGFWGRQWNFCGPDGARLVEFQSRGVLRRRAEVKVSHAARRSGELPVLVLLGWYLITLQHHEAAAAAS
jgi:hypothetical protein